VSTRDKKFKRTPPNQAGPLERKKAFRILKQLATNLIREDKTSKLDYQEIQEDIAWAKGRLRHRYDHQEQAREVDRSSATSEQEGQPTNRGTWSRSFAEVVKDRKIIGVIDQGDEGGRIHRNQWGLVRRALASVALKVLDENWVRHPIAQMEGGTRAMLIVDRLVGRKIGSTLQGCHKQGRRGQASGRQPG